MTLESSIPDLVLKARGGDRKAFDTLVRQHEDRLNALVRSRLRYYRVNQVEPEDVFQEVFLRSFGAIETVSTPARKFDPRKSSKHTPT